MSQADRPWTMSSPSVQAVQQTLVESHQFPPHVVESTLAKARYLPNTADILQRSPSPDSEPSPGTWTRYKASFVSDQRIQGGVEFWRNYRSALRRATAQYQIPAEYIVAIIGVESAYGQNMGNDRVLDALATSAFVAHRRDELYQDELVEYFLYIRETGLDPVSLEGNYVGAIGYGQFLPSSVRQYGRDHDADGQVRVWEPIDAIGSVANYLQSHGWQSDEAFVVPTRLEGLRYQSLMFGWRGDFTLDELAANGVYPQIPYEADRLSLIRLRHTDYDEFLIGGQNFYAITRYNNSTRYAMAVHELAQAIKAAL